MLAILALGFASGLPLALTASTLTAWLTESGIDMKAIGLFALAGTPYAFKFAWSPLVDSLHIPYLTRRFGRRRGWLILSQCLLVCGILLMSLLHPSEQTLMVAACAFAIACFSATQDIVIDAYRIEILKPEEYGAGSTAAVLGWRLGALASGGGALALAEFYGWPAAYICMALIAPVGILTVMLTGEPASYSPGHEAQKNFSTWFKSSVISPFADFIQHKGWLAILLFVVLYKLGDSFAGMMTNPFLLKLGFTKLDIAAIVKTYGLFATIIGSIIGGAMIPKFGLFKSLLICGILQMLSNLAFVAQARAGVDPLLLTGVISIENLSSGMGTAVFVAYISSLCKVEFTATQYALLSSLAASGRAWIVSNSGFAVEDFGWEGFFILSTIIAIPGILLLIFGRKYLIR